MIIESIIPHPSEEDLDVVTLGPGVKCVVHKGLFKTGDRVNLVPVKTVKKGVICHGLIVKETEYVELEPLSMAEVFDGGDDSIARAHMMDPDALEDMNPDYHGAIDEIEEDGKVWAEDE